MQYVASLFHHKKEQTYAVCYRCETVFLDDVPTAGSVFCECGFAVRRGISAEQADGMVDGGIKYVIAR